MQREAAVTFNHFCWVGAGDVLLFSIRLDLAFTSPPTALWGSHQSAMRLSVFPKQVPGAEIFFKVTS